MRLIAFVGALTAVCHHRYRLRMASQLIRSGALIAAALVVACGGKAVVDAPPSDVAGSSGNWGSAGAAPSGASGGALGRAGTGNAGSNDGGAAGRGSGGAAGHISSGGAGGVATGGAGGVATGGAAGAATGGEGGVGSTPTLGDVTGDGCVNVFDLATLLQNYGLTIPPLEPRFDLDGDGVVGQGDLLVVENNWGQGCKGQGSQPGTQ